MSAVVLDGSVAGDPMAARILSALVAHRPDAEVITLRERRIGNCAGDFFCWVRSPGVCNIDDDNRIIAARAARADLLVCLTPVTFGGYGAMLKRAVDHLIQNLSPYFRLVDGETHHRARYRANPDLLAIGWLPAPDPPAEAVFHHLVGRNAINLHAGTSVSGVVPAPEVDAPVAAWLRAVEQRTGTVPGPLPEVAPAPGAVPASRAVLLVGSPRTRNSTSYALGSHLMAGLAERGVHTETIQIYTSMGSARRRGAALDAVRAADLVVLAAPTYVDSLPGPVTAALERIAQAGAPHGPQRFAAILNCGFPEAAHNATALAIAAQFAHAYGAGWSGGLALGGGEGLVHGVPLAEAGARATPLMRALDVAADALAAGLPIPPAAHELMARPIVPRWVYRLAGGYGWRREARRLGTRTPLSHRPYQTDPAPRSPTALTGGRRS